MVDVDAVLVELMWWKEEMRLSRRVVAKLDMYLSFGDWAVEDWRVKESANFSLRRERSAGYAAPRSWRASFSGVMVGRERRHGLMASSKTEERLVRWRMSDLLSLIGERSCERMSQPQALKEVVSSSISERIGGTISGKWASMWDLSAGCESVSELVLAFSRRRHVLGTS